MLTAYRRNPGGGPHRGILGLDTTRGDRLRLIDAIASGVPGERVKDRVAALESRKIELERFLETSDEPRALLHPNMASHYRTEVERLHEATIDNVLRAEAAEIIRSLVDRIVLNPQPEGSAVTMTLDLHGTLQAS